MERLLLEELTTRESLTEEYFLEAFHHALPIPAFSHFALRLCSDHETGHVEISQEEGIARIKVHNTIRSMARVRRGLSPMRRALRDSITCWRARHVLHSRQSNKLFYVEHIESESILGEEHDAFDRIVVEWMFLSEYSLRGFIAFDWVDGWVDFLEAQYVVMRWHDVILHVEGMCMERRAYEEGLRDRHWRRITTAVALERTVIEEGVLRVRIQSTIRSQRWRELLRTWHTLMGYARRDVEFLESVERPRM